MDINERRRQITEILSVPGYVTVEELAQKLNVSSVTIRSDLTALEKTGTLVRTHGGAMSAEKKSTARLLSETMTEYGKQKKAIAARAAGFITEGSTIIVDSGSTTVHLLEYVSGKNITVVTNSIPAVDRLKEDPSVEVFIIGGSLKRSYMGTIGPLANNAMSLLNVDVYFMGAANYNKDGITSTNLMEAELKRAMMKAADKVVFLADSSKYGRKAFASLCRWDEIDAFVTDSIDADFRAYLEDKGIEVLTAAIPE